MKFKIFRFAAKHRLSFTLVLNVLVCSVYSVLLALADTPLWLIVPLDLFLCFTGTLIPKLMASKLVLAACDALNNHCDPEPLYLETKTQLSYKISDTDRQLFLIDHCVALREMGQWQQAMDILKTIHIDQYPGTLPASKAVYYNNLSDLCELLGDNAAADIWYEKMMQIYNDLPDNRLKKTVTPAVPAANAAFHARNGRYDQAMTWAKQMPQDNRHRTVNYALHYGRISIGLKDYENARKALQYAAANGNKTCVVTIAQRLLVELKEAEKTIEI